MHIAKVAAKANARVGLIKRTFSYIDKEIFLSLYTALVRPILDYGVQCWSPYLVKDINKLEQVQRRATLLVPDCSALSLVMLRDVSFWEFSHCRTGELGGT